MFEHDKFHNEATAEERGEKRKALEIARNLKSKGISIAIISETSGLTLAEVEKA
jgi:predicted transposase YdaD